MVDSSTQTNQMYLEKPKIERYSISDIVSAGRTQTSSGRKVKRSNYIENSSDDEEIYPSKRRKSVKNEKIIGTCIPVFRIPYVMQNLETCLKDHTEKYEEIFDFYSIETLLLNCSLDVYSFKNENELFEFVKTTVLDTDEFKIKRKNIWNNPIPQPSYDEENDKKVIEAYNDLINSEENQKLGYWKSNSTKMKIWNKEDWKKFEEAYKLYPDSAHSNRLISLKMGSGVHPNHVAHYKKIYKKNIKLGLNPIEEIDDSINDPNSTNENEE
eukprot:gene11156-3978_t